MKAETGRLLNDVLHKTTCQNGSKRRLSSFMLSLISERTTKDLESDLILVTVAEIYLRMQVPENIKLKLDQ